MCAQSIEWKALSPSIRSPSEQCHHAYSCGSIVVQRLVRLIFLDALAWFYLSHVVMISKPVLLEFKSFLHAQIQILCVRLSKPWDRFTIYHCLNHKRLSTGAILLLVFKMWFFIVCCNSFTMKCLLKRVTTSLPMHCIA